MQVLSQFMDKPRQPYLSAAHRVLRYLKASPGQGLIFSVISDFHFKGLCDSNWAVCVDIRKSVIRFLCLS